jgi:hypothetical protein
MGIGLGLDSVGTFAPKPFNAQVLFDPFEEKLYLPTVHIELDDLGRFCFEMVGQVYIGQLPFGIKIFYPAEFFRILPGRIKSF